MLISTSFSLPPRHIDFIIKESKKLDLNRSEWLRRVFDEMIRAERAKRRQDSRGE